MSDNQRQNEKRSTATKVSSARMLKSGQHSSSSDDNSDAHTTSLTTNFSQVSAAGKTQSGRLIQANLMVNAPGDRYEQEADHVANTVMSMHDAPMPSPLNGVLGSPSINRMPQISRAGSTEGNFETSDSTEARISQMQGGGQALPESERNFFESRMGYDFSNVRTHTDGNAVQASRDIQATAFTIGNNIAFNEGAYQPGTSAGRKLLAHELTHVVQQGAAVQRKPILQRLMENQSRSELMRYLDNDLGERPSGQDLQLYRKEIANFQNSHSPAQIQAKQASILGTSDIGKDHSHTIRRKGSSSDTASDTATTAPDPLTFEVTAFSPSSGGSLEFKSDGSNAVIDSSDYETTGTVKTKGGTKAEAKKWEVGFIQTVFISKRVGHYDGSDEYQRQVDEVVGVTRDGDKGKAPWYEIKSPGKEKFTDTEQSKSTEIWDKPGTFFPWDSPSDSKGKKAKLASSSGTDSFVSWLIVRNKDTKDIQYLKNVSWNVDYGMTFNYADTDAKTVKAKTGKTTVTGSGDGQGSKNPVLGDPVANDAAATKWEP